MLQKILLTLTFCLPALPALAMATPILPEPANQPLVDPLAQCSFLNNNLDATEIAVDATGNLLAKTNPKYLSGQSQLSPYLLYRGVNVNVMDSFILIQGTIFTISGEIKVNLKLIRGTTSTAMVDGQAVNCRAN